MDENLVFKNPVTGVEKPALSINMVQDLTPTVVANILATTKYSHDVSYAKRAILAAFIEPDVKSLFIELAGALIHHQPSLINVAVNIESPEVESIFTHVDQIISGYFSITLEEFDSYYTKLLPKINSFDAAIMNKVFSWMDEQDEEKLWTILFVSLAEKKKPALSINFI